MFHVMIDAATPTHHLWTFSQMFAVTLETRAETLVEFYLQTLGWKKGLKGEIRENFARRFSPTNVVQIHGKHWETQRENHIIDARRIRPHFQWKLNLSDPDEFSGEVKSFLRLSKVILLGWC